MNKLLLSAVALASLTGSAVAADMPARTYTKAPTAPASTWTGFYIFGGGGYGIFDSSTYTTFGGAPVTIGQKAGGDGYVGTVGAGYDWQFAPKWVAGVFADGQFGSIKGSLPDNGLGLVGQVKDQTNAAAGGRFGYLVAPAVLSYVNGGYSYGQFSGSTLLDNIAGTPVSTTPSFHSNGWFVGGGVENNLDIFGISAPGWFMKTEYRTAQYQRTNLIESFGGFPSPIGVSTKPMVETVSTSLVYRFNWGGPILSKY